MKKYLIILLFSCTIDAWRIPAVVSVAVADLTGHTVKAGGSVDRCYATLPCAPDKGNTACLRLHQLKANDRVIMTREFYSGEVIVEVPGLFYFDRKNRRRNDFWSLKKYFKPLRSFSKKVQDCVPPAIDRNQPGSGYENILTLRRPWLHKGTWYSIGTRFVRASDHDTDKTYGINVIDYSTRQSHTASVAKELAVVTYHTDFVKARRVFMALLRDWAHQKEGLIPYVWGGYSSTTPCLSNGFIKYSGKQCGQSCSFWEHVGYKATPRTGFDCSNMILCAAQIAGMPYFCKNTQVIARTLRPLRSGEKIEEGDIIYYSGHVLVVSDVKKNYVIEAVGYDAGYGQVHETHIKNVFEEIHNFNGLRPCHFRKKPTRRLRKNGTPWRSVYGLKILKLKSIVA